MTFIVLEILKPIFRCLLQGFQIEPGAYVNENFDNRLRVDDALKKLLRTTVCIT